MDAAELDIGWGLLVLLRGYLCEAEAAFTDVPGGPRGYQLLVSAERGEPATQAALAQRLCVDRTVMTHLIDHLAKEGLVQRQMDPGDRRAYRIVATAKGRDLLPELDERLARVEAAVLGGLSEADALRFRQILRTAAAWAQEHRITDDVPDVLRLGRRPRRRASPPLTAHASRNPNAL